MLVIGSSPNLQLEIVEEQEFVEALELLVDNMVATIRFVCAEVTA